MKYSDKNPREAELFKRSNLIGLNIDLEDYFGRIDLFDNNTFQDFYVERSINRYPPEFTRQISDLRAFNRNNWYNLSKDPSHSNAKWTRTNLNGIFKLVSPIATGKTTYIRYLTRIYLPTQFPEFNYHILTYDFTDDFVTTKNISGEKIAFKLLDELLLIKEIFGDPRDTKSFYEKRYPVEKDIWRDVFISNGLDPSALQEEYSTEYQNDLQIITQSKNKDPLNSLLRYINYVYNLDNSTRLVIVIDNIDHYSNVDHEFAQSIVQTLNQRLFSTEIPCTIFFPIRDATVRSYQDPDVIAAFHDMESITLSKVDTNLMGYRRVQFILTHFGKIRIANSARGQKRSLAVVNVLRLIKHIVRQLKKAKEPKSGSDHRYADVWQWLDDLGNGDLRSVLDRFKHAISSYHLLDTNFSKGFEPGAQEGELTESSNLGDLNEIVNPKRFKTALINCDSPYFDPANPNTRVVNLFDAGDSGVSGNYILRLKLLKLLEEEEVFEVYKTIEKILSKSTPKHKTLIENSINLFIEKGLLLIERTSKDGASFEERSPPYDWKDIVGNGYIGPNGKLHLNTLIYDDIYLDEMKYSTNFVRKEYDKIFESTKKDILNREKDGRYSHISKRKKREIHIRAIIRKEETEAFVRFIDRENRKNNKLLNVQFDTNEIGKAYSSQKRSEIIFFKVQ